MTTPSTIQDFATELNVTAAITRAITFDARLAALWTIPCRYSDRVFTSGGWGGGRFRDGSHRGISLNPAQRACTLDEQQRTFLHEVAHVCETILYGRTTHSQTWWEAMICLGEKPWENRYLSREAAAAMRNSRADIDTITI